MVHRSSDGASCATLLLMSFDPANRVFMREAAGRPAMH
jgi:hypothetical protein